MKENNTLIQTFNENKITKCPYCNCSNIKEGKLLKHAALINTEKRNFSTFSSEFSSPLIFYVCTNCGNVLNIKVENLKMFE